MSTYSFIDASNIIYGTRDEGWKVDFRKLFKYLKERYRLKRFTISQELRKTIKNKWRF